MCVFCFLEQACERVYLRVHLFNKCECICACTFFKKVCVRVVVCVRFFKHTHVYVHRFVIL